MIDVMDRKATEEEIAWMESQLGTRVASVEGLGSLLIELRQLAGGFMGRERADHTLQPTALVNEAFLRLSKSRNLEGADRLGLLEAAAVAMRRILVEHARRKKAEKRGGAWERVTLMGIVEEAGSVDGVDLLALQEALSEFEALDPRAARIVELRFFGGMTGDEIAEHLSVSRNTVVRELTMARAWLKRALGSCEEDEARGSNGA